MNLGAIAQHPHSKMFLALEHERCQPVNVNYKILASTNIDISKLAVPRFSDLPSLGEAMNEIALAQIIQTLTEQNPEFSSFDSLKDKYEMCHRGLVPVLFLVNKFSEINVLAFSDENPEEFHVTRFFKIGDSFQHSFEMQGENLHFAYPKFYGNI